MKDLIWKFKQWIYRKSLRRIREDLKQDRLLFGNSYYLKKEGILFKRAIRLDPRRVIIGMYTKDRLTNNER